MKYKIAIHNGTIYEEGEWVINVIGEEPQKIQEIKLVDNQLYINDAIAEFMFNYKWVH